ncbi:helix-turn-helix transcriptional regulator [uncultured Maribacter sp.]|uniref:helix-turn-helix domain-containing protein n=1 Tax=uncultured Maribacter sp. TaxID=431308 RepID=UPI002616647C|nr:helix-turn-helix transcriptional regulator [uncultured Maribacter sp.]
MIIFIYFLSFLQGLIFALILLFSKSYKSSINKYLAYTILIISFLGLMNGIDTQIGDSYYFLFELVDQIPLETLFPATFLNFISLKTNSKLCKEKHAYLYIPFYLFTITNILLITLDAIFYKNNSELPFLIYVLLEIPFYFSLLYSFTTCVLNFVLINSANHLRTENKKWLKYLATIYFAPILIWLFSEIYEMFNDTEPIYLEYCLWVGVTTFFYWISYKGLIRFRLLEDRHEITQVIHSILSKEKREINKDISNSHFQKLEALMQKEHAYLDSNLSRENIANQIGISPGYLSKIVSSITNDNFSEYINAYRVNAVKNMIKNPDFNQYSLLAIGYESGFSSKTGFYNAFKKHTGVTPNTYKTTCNRS